MKIYAPVKTATGTYCSVRFVNGVGETNNPHLISWFLDHGYRVEDVKEKVEPKTSESTLNEVLTTTSSEEEESDSDEVDLESMTPNEIRDWAKANGHGSKIKNIRNKEKLIEVLRG